MVGSLRRRFVGLLVLLALTSLAPWWLAVDLHDHLHGFAQRLDIAGTLRYRIVELGLVTQEADAGSPLTHGEVKSLLDGQRRALETLIQGDAARDLPPCRVKAVCQRLYAHLDRWNSVIAPAIYDRLEGRGRRPAVVQKLLLDEVSEVDGTVHLLAHDAEQRVNAVVGQGLAAVALALILVLLVGYGVWEVFQRIRRVQEATHEPVGEAELERQGKGSDEVATLANSLLTSLRSLRLRNEADKRRVARLDGWQQALQSFAAELNDWIDGKGDLSGILSRWASGSGLESAIARVDRYAPPGAAVAELAPRTGGRAASVTLSWHDERLGSLDIVRAAAGPAGAEERAMWEAAARVLSIAVVARRLLEERSQRSEIAESLASVRRLDEGPPDLGKKFRAHIAHDYASLVTLDEGGAVEHAMRFDDPDLVRLHLESVPPVPETVTVLDGPNPLSQRLFARDVASTLVLPLRDEPHPVGILFLGRLEGRFTEREKDAGRALCPVVAAAILRMRLSERLLLTEQLATVGGFSKMVAHEVRNPLNNLVLQIRLLTRLLQDLDVPVDDAEKIVRHIETLKSETARLDAVVESYVTLATGSGSARFEEVDLRTLVRDALAVHAPALEDRGIELTMELGDRPAVSLVDRVRYGQAVHNLVKNALDAMDGTGGRLTVRLVEQAGAFALHVADSGPGIAEPARIFAPSYTTKTSGSGMGLPVSLHIARLHGGSLVARDAPGGGAEMVLTVAKRSPDRALASQG